MSLALLVMAVVEHGNLSIDCSGASPTSSGLMRLGRDLMRHAGSDLTTRGPLERDASSLGQRAGSIREPPRFRSRRGGHRQRIESRVA